MKVFALVILAMASVSAKGSGPYLPSGWKPQGPSFYLPSEVVVNPEPENPVNEVLEGSEASGSDSLREYGPPNVVEISQNLISQALPDVATEVTFGVAQEVKTEEVQSVENAEANVKLSTEAEVATEVVVEEKTTASTPVEEKIVEVAQTTDANGVQTTDIDVTQFEYVVSGQEPTVASEISQDSQTTEVAKEESQTTEEVQVSEQEEQGSNQEASLVSQEASESTEKSDDSEESLVVVPLSQQNLQNIPDIIASLEKEVIVQQAEVSQAVSDVSNASGNLEQAPEGFLEYGPPGFTEYGPPKGDLVEEEKSEIQPFASNEARRRRFSPKFRPSKKH